MRVRKKKNGGVRLEACGELLLPVDKENPAPIALEELFPRAKSYRIEIGCGKGAFVNALAQANPDVGFLAVEKISDVILPAAEKARDGALDNIRFLNCDAALLPKLFPEKCFDRIYLNFCDPWPKARHAKRRLTYPATLVAMKTFLADGGKIEFKTDNGDLFAYSLGSFVEAGYTLDAVTDDLHASEWAATNIMTEYEKNFSEKGFPIHRLEAFLEK